MAKVILPDILKQFTENQTELDIEGSTVREVLRSLVARYPGLKNRLFTEAETLRHYVNIYKGQDYSRSLEDIDAPASLQDMDAPVKDEEELIVVPSASGG